MSMVPPLQEPNTEIYPASVSFWYLSWAIGTAKTLVPAHEIRSAAATDVLDQQSAALRASDSRPGIHGGLVRRAIAADTPDPLDE